MTSTHLRAFEARRSGFRRRTATGETLTSLGSAVRRAARTYAERRATRRAVDQLRYLDSRTLQDIGLTPGAVDPARARAATYRDRGGR
jgi:uncharacterized protein YjiS (DUF1127 family)